MKQRILCKICLPLLLWFSFAGYWKDTEQIPIFPIPSGETVMVCGSVYRQEIQNKKHSVYLKNISILSSAEILPETSIKHKVIKQARIRVLLKNPYQVKQGERIVVSGILTYPEAARNPGEFDMLSYYKTQKIVAILKNANIKKTDRQTFWPAEWLCRVRTWCIERFERDAIERDAGIFRAMLLGDRSDLDESVKTLYQDVGIIHILAISGLHISMIGMLLFSVLRKCGCMFSSAGILSGILMGMYAALTGFSWSAVRAVIMFVMYLIAQATGRTYDMATALMIAAVAILTFQEGAVTQAGFLLSFAAVGGVLLANTWNSKILKGKALGVSLAIQLITLPLMAWYYYRIPVYGIFLNLLVIPMAPFLLGFAGAGIFLGSVFFESAHILLMFLEKLSLYVRRLPYSEVLVPKPQPWQIVLYYVCLCLILLKGNRMRKIWTKAICMVLLVGRFLFFPYIQPYQMTFLDVGQGDGCCIELPGIRAGSLRIKEGEIFMVDGGSSTKKEVAEYILEPFFRSRGIGKIDYWMVTHFDLDHISGLLEILESYELDMLGNNTAGVTIGTILLPIRKEMPEQGERICELAEEHQIDICFVKAGDLLQMGDVQVHILSPHPDIDYQNENEASIVGEVVYEHFRTLLTGDVEGNAEKRLFQGEYHEIDLLKAAHHGSGFSSEKSFLEQIRPKMTIISCGRKNRYGHPHKEVLERLENIGSSILRTDQSGAIMVMVKDGFCRIIPYLQDR